MRYLGNKSKLLDFISSVINKYKIKGESFADFFSGTGSVGDFFKDKYDLIGNDCMYFSYVLFGAKFLNASEPSFLKFKQVYGFSPFEYLNAVSFKENQSCFVLNNFTSRAGRMFFTEENALKIDGMRQLIEEFYKNDIINRQEYLFLLASLLESVTKVSNTSGTYQAFFKFWESRALKPFAFEPLEMNCVSELKNRSNKLFNTDSNTLARQISGDIVYIDPPYTTNQYANSYHLLETIALYDYPDLFGKTGRRKKRTLSRYSNKHMAIYEFEDLFRQLKFKHILVSYSDQSIVKLDDLVNLASKFAKNGVVHVEKTLYREYSTNNSSHKNNGNGLHETIIYFEKDINIVKSPLNYSGSKDKVMPRIIAALPKHIGTFVDAMGGAFNVGANVAAIDSCVYNEYNPYVYGVVKMLCEEDKERIVETTKKYISSYNLRKKDKNSYLKFRDYYNLDKKPDKLFVLQMYAFQNMIRFNSKFEFNTPIGNNEYNLGTEKRILGFVPKTKKVSFINKKYQEIDINDYPKDTLFYFDPPYFITKAEYNDGKRGFDGWDISKEKELLTFLKRIHNSGRKFLLSNVISHNGKEHTLLKSWVDKNGFIMDIVGTTGIKYPRTEILISNYIIEKGY